MKSVGEYSSPVVSVNSVKSVGEYFPRSRFCGFCEFRGRIGRGRRGYCRMPYPPMKTPTDCTLSLQKKAIRLNNQGKTMIAKDSFVPLL